ncbi:MAG: hypothetical protein WC745_01950 [Patescibacteria group bacterium]|jgi:hypothetical protein
MGIKQTVEAILPPDSEPEDSSKSARRPEKAYLRPVKGSPKADSHADLADERLMPELKTKVEMFKKKYVASRDNLDIFDCIVKNLGSTNNFFLYHHVDGKESEEEFQAGAPKVEPQSDIRHAIKDMIERLNNEKNIKGDERLELDSLEKILIKTEEARRRLLLLKKARFEIERKTAVYLAFQKNTDSGYEAMGHQLNKEEIDSIKRYLANPAKHQDKRMEEKIKNFSGLITREDMLYVINNPGSGAPIDALDKKIFEFDGEEKRQEQILNSAAHGLELFRNQLYKYFQSDLDQYRSFSYYSKRPDEYIAAMRKMDFLK